MGFFKNLFGMEEHPAPLVQPKVVNIPTLNRGELPEWASLGEMPRNHQIIDVNAPAMYEDWLGRLDVTEITQFDLECAYQCMKMELQATMGTFAIEIRIHDTEKKYKLSKWPDNSGKDVHKASKGLGARERFKELYGFIPGA